MIALKSRARGAGVLVLEELEHAKARGAKIYCEVAGAGMSADAHHITASHPEGLGANLVMKAALEDAEMKPEDIDWKAKFEEQRAHSRKWEQRAKDNSKAAEELQQFKDSQLSEAEKAAKRTQELEAQVAAYKAKEQQADWKAQVSAETGVPADVIEGDSLEAMQSHAKRIHELLNPKPKAPAVHGADRQPSGKGPNESMVNYLRNLGL